MTVAFLPFFHIYGQVVIMLFSLVQGFTLVLMTTPDMDDILQCDRNVQCISLLWCADHVRVSQRIRKNRSGELEEAQNDGCGADTLHESTMNDWERRTGSKILEGYGMTESTSLSHGSPMQRPKSGSFGVPIPSLAAAIIDHERAGFRACRRGW